MVVRFCLVAALAAHRLNVSYGAVISWGLLHHGGCLIVFLFRGVKGFVARWRSSQT